MTKFTRRDFLKIGGAGVAGAATFPFLGRMALAQSTDNFFTIAVISDSQFYNDGQVPQPLNLNIFKTQTNYLAQNISALKLRFVTHVGDVIEHGDCSSINYPGKTPPLPQTIEWTNATQALDILHAAGIPFGLSIGNHDYDNMYASSQDVVYPPLVSTPNWWANYFGSGSKYFKGKSWYVGASDNVGYISTGNKSAPGQYPPAGTRCNYGLSSAQVFSAGGKMFLHLSLELEPGDAAIVWAQNVIDSYPNYATIVTTHSYMSPPAWGDNTQPTLQPGPNPDPAQYNAAQWMIGSPNGYNAACDNANGGPGYNQLITHNQIWNKLIARNNQIFMVLCGHSWTGISTAANKDLLDQNGNPITGVSKGENLRIDLNNSGNPVYQALTDYQGNILLGSGSLTIDGGGGDGWYRFMQFDMTTGYIHFYTVNPCQTPFNQQTGQVIQLAQATKAGQNVVYPDRNSDFDQPEGFSDFSLAMPVQVLNAPRGAH